MRTQENSFHTLRKLIDLTANGSGQFPDSQGEAVPKKFAYHPSASEASFDELLRKGMFLPPGLRQLLDISNGFEIYNFEGVDGYKIFSTSELPTINASIRGSYDNSWDIDTVVFAECIGDGSYLAIKRTEEGDQVIDCFLEVDVSEWKIISPDIYEFFGRLIEANGQKFWLDESSNGPETSSVC